MRNHDAEFIRTATPTDTESKSKSFPPEIVTRVERIYSRLIPSRNVQTRRNALGWTLGRNRPGHESRPQNAGFHHGKCFRWNCSGLFFSQTLRDVWQNRRREGIYCCVTPGLGRRSFFCSESIIAAELIIGEAGLFSLTAPSPCAQLTF